MKNLIDAISVTIITALLLGSCSDKFQDNGTNNRRDISVRAYGPSSTRTSYEGDGINHIIHWCGDDLLGVFAFSHNGTLVFADNEPFAITENHGISAIFDGYMNDRGIGSQTHDIVYHAYYPYQSSSLENGILTVSIPSEQRPTAVTFDGKADILISRVIETHASLGEMDNGNGPMPLAFRFTRPVAIVKLDFANIPEPATEDRVETIRFSIEGEFLAGEMKIHVSEGSYCAGEKTTDEINLHYASGDLWLGGEDFSAWFAMAPVSSRTITLNIETENYLITKDIEAASDLTFLPNHVNRLTIDLSAGTTVRSRTTEFTITPDLFENSYVASSKEHTLYDSKGNPVIISTNAVKREQETIVWQNSVSGQINNITDLQSVTTIAISDLSGGVLEVYEGPSANPQTIAVPYAVEENKYVFTLSGNYGFFTIKHPGTSGTTVSTISVTYK